MKRSFRNSLLTLFVIVLLMVSGSATLRADETSTDGYQLKEVVVLSRHNIRAPLSTKGSVLDSATPHTWYEWSYNASELSLRGGLLETAMGQYFRKWLENEGLFPENFRPENDEVFFYSNAKQRTIATAKYFCAGLLPVANIPIETRQEYDKMDPVFTPQLTFVNEKYAEDAKKQMVELLPDLSEEYALLSDVIDLKDSDAYKSEEIKDLVDGDNEFILEENAEPGVKGSLRTATSLADALVLQYYEENDEKEAAFGHELSSQDWEAISYIKDVYCDVLFTAPLVSVNVANPLLKQIEKELNDEGRLFTFLCGHDSNLGSVLSALDVKDYQLPQAIEKKTPIGSKIVFEKWEKEGEEYIRVRLVYNSVEQLRNISILDMENEPVSFVFQFNGLEANRDGMYRASDFIDHLSDRISEYDRLIRKYDPQGSAIPKTGIE